MFIMSVNPSLNLEESVPNKQTFIFWFYIICTCEWNSSATLAMKIAT